MTPSKILFYFCLSFMAGIFVGSLFSFASIYLFYFLTILSLVILIFFFRKTKFCFLPFIYGSLFIVLCSLFFVLGIWRYQIADIYLKDSGLRQYNDKEVILAGKILTEPDIRENTIQLVVNAEKILVGDEVFPVSGKVLIKTNKYPEYNYADVIIIKGLLKTPSPTIFNGLVDSFDYKDYLAKKGIFSLIDWPEIELFAKENYSNFWQFSYGQILKFKNKIRENINQSFSFTESKLFSGILLGDQSNFSADFKDKLNITGLRHITAISGMNVAIICSVLMSLFLGIGLWRNQAFYLTVIFIFLFVAMIGFQASVVRAGIMGVIMLLAQKFGRLSTSARAIVITATIMLLLNPMLLRWDVGFQLSFLAILGIVLLAKPIESFLRFIPQEKFINLRSVISATLSAQIFTLPILIYNFGRISLISPITNILVVPIIDWLMILGFLFGILSTIWSALAWIFIWPCWFLITYTLKVIDIFSQPWAIKSVENVHWSWLIILYFILSIFVIWMKKKEKLKFLEY